MSGKQYTNGLNEVKESSNGRKRAPEGEWGMVPYTVYTDHRLSHAERSVLGALFKFRRNKDGDSLHGWAWPSPQLLADDLGMEVRTLRRHLRELERLGWIERNKAADVVPDRVRDGRALAFLIRWEPQRDGEPKGKQPRGNRALVGKQPRGNRALVGRVLNREEEEQYSVGNRSGEKRPMTDPSLFEILAEVTATDPNTSRSSIAKVAHELKDAGYTAEDVRDFEDWWWADDFRKDRGEPPTLWKVRERIGVLRSEAGPRDPTCGGKYGKIQVKAIRRKRDRGEELADWEAEILREVESV